MFLQIEHKLLPKDSVMHFTPSTEQQQHRAPKHRAGAAPSTQHQARAPSTKHPAPSTKHTAAAAAAAAARFSTRTGEPTQLPNGSRRERGGHHSLIRLKSCLHPHFVILCLPGISSVGQSSWYLISQPGGCCPGVCITLCPTICVRCGSEARVDGGGQMP